MNIVLSVLLLAGAISAPAAGKEILLIAGAPSHGAGQHEHNAGVLLLQQSLGAVKEAHVTVSLNGAWPENAALEKADAIFLFSDGAGSHPIFKSNERIAAIDKAAARGAGLMFHHYATEPPEGKGRAEMLKWIGGYFELNYSVNPIWEANFESLPKHPITRGVMPFRIRDEWYFNIRFPEMPRGFTSILSATPPPEAFSDKDGPRLGNAGVRGKRGQPQVLAWAVQRADGGRGVGWTGGHYHRNLGDENFRRLVLNAILWIAKIEVPAGGVKFTAAESDLTKNLDPKPARGPGVSSSTPKP